MRKELIAGFQRITPRHVLTAVLWCTVLAPIGLLVALAWIVYWMDDATKGQIKQSANEKRRIALEQPENEMLELLSLPTENAVLEFA